VRIRVLGSAAGGGFPQWNCGCENCEAVRRGTGGDARARTQESVAVSADGERWFLLNVSPEIRAQIESFPALWPRARRHSPLAGILLTNGDLDHCLGLLSLRESHPLVVYATDSVRAGFQQGNVLYRTLQRFDGQVTWRALALGREQPLGPDGAGLLVTAIAAPGKLPLHLEELRPPSPEDNVGLVIRDERTGGRLAYFSGVAGPSDDIARAAGAADVVFFDGTFWSSDELIASGLGTRRAEEMAHWPLGGKTRGGDGAGGSVDFLTGIGAGASAGRGARRRVLIHINNTNPILREGSAERRALEARGIEVASDGMELEL
jgi:pyrroloquinoline quinone biosynthesis protein B